MTGIKAESSFIRYISVYIYLPARGSCKREVKLICAGEMSDEEPTLKGCGVGVYEYPRLALSKGFRRDSSSFFSPGDSRGVCAEAFFLVIIISCQETDLTNFLR